jgi:cell division septation protein DedD
MNKMPSPVLRKVFVPPARYFNVGLLLLLMGFLVACNGSADVVLPTSAAVAVAPSLTSTPTLLPEAAYTATWTPRATHTPYVTPTFVNTAQAPNINTRASAPGGTGVIWGGGATVPTVTRAVPRSTQTAVAVTATAVVSATRLAATATQIAATATSLAGSATPLPNNWRGEYFNNSNLSGTAVFVRNDADIRFNWGAGSPDSRIPADRFSVRWVRDVTLANATYLFYAYSDDGVRVFLNDTPIINEWHAASNRVFPVYVAVSAGVHRLRVEYYEEGGDAHVGFGWELANEFAWMGAYYNNATLTGPPVYVRQDNAINFNWGTGGPNGLSSDNFSIRWTRNINFANRTYAFVARSDDGIRVFVNNNVIIDQWGPNNGQTQFRRELLLSGTRLITVEYYEGTGTALVNVNINPLSGATPTSTNTPTRTPVPPTATLAPSLTPTATASPTLPPTPTATGTATPTESPTPSPSPTATPTETPTPSPTP